MSTPDAHPAPAHASHDTHEFTGEPVTELPADEPRTPAWMPVLGLALFVIGGIYFLASGDSPPPAAPAPAVKAAVEAPAPAVANPRPAATQPGGTQKLTPEQVEALKKRMEDMRKRGGLPDVGKGHP